MICFASLVAGAMLAAVAACMLTFGMEFKNTFRGFILTFFISWPIFSAAVYAKASFDEKNVIHFDTNCENGIFTLNIKEAEMKKIKEVKVNLTPFEK